MNLNVSPAESHAPFVIIVFLLIPTAQNATREEIINILDNINHEKLTDLSWEPFWTPAHGLKTSSLGGCKLGTSMKGTDGHHHAALFHSTNRIIHGTPLSRASWVEKPSPADIITGLKNVSFVSGFQFRSTTMPCLS
jgi:hypothetical protein